MKKLFSGLLMSSSMILSSLALGSCGTKKENKEEALMIVDINPSIELVLDDENKVVSVTALNDDGSVIISGEVLIGLSAEDAARKIVEISIETGYISKDNAKDITFTLTGNTADEIYNKISENVTKFVQEKGINSAIKQGKALAEEELKKLLLEANPSLTEEEISSLSVKEVLQQLGESRKEYASILTEELREAYLSFKENRIEFAEKEETAKIIEKLGAAYETTLASYHMVLEQIDVAAKAVNDAYFTYLIDDESEYQQTLAKLEKARIQLVSVRSANTPTELLKVLKGENFKDIQGIEEIISTLETAIQLSSLAPETAQKAYENIREVILPLLENALTNTKTLLETVGKIAKDLIDTTVQTLNTVKANLEELEKLFPEDIKTELMNKVVELENAVNDAKDLAFTKFEEQYKETITEINNKFAEYKTALKNATNSEK